jgi:nitrite reductase/ring-hydroxylating ferredoxin subunit
VETSADSSGVPAAAADTPAEAAWQKLDGLDPVAGKFPAPARVDGDGILIFRTKTGFRGVQRLCPHLKFSLHDADLVSNDTMIRCKQHVFTFRLADGRGVNCPGFSVSVFEVKNEDGTLYARRTR